MLPDNACHSIDSARNLGIILSWIKIFFFSTHLILFQILLPQYSWSTADSTFLDRSLLPLLLLIAATSLIHSKIDYCNSLLLNLPATQIDRLQLVLNSAARAVTWTAKFHHVGPLFPILKSLHWLTINQIIQYKCLTNLKKLVTHPISSLIHTSSFYSLFVSHHT
jgi:hypothetical protein